MLAGQKSVKAKFTVIGHSNLVPQNSQDQNLLTQTLVLNYKNMLTRSWKDKHLCTTIGMTNICRDKNLNTQCWQPSCL